jgi:hypothetical protein
MSTKEKEVSEITCRSSLAFLTNKIVVGQLKNLKIEIREVRKVPDIDKKSIWSFEQTSSNNIDMGPLHIVFKSPIDFVKLENFCKAPSTVFATYNFSHSLSKLKIVDDNDLIYSKANLPEFTSVKNAVPGKKYLNPNSESTPENSKYVKHEVEEGKEVVKQTDPTGEQIIKVLN